ncbi:unnamed protein product [Dibothriocephalus latus]|uniref:Cytosolic carboxypeptidase N-terminal domain-containing protein n=1 Tax=Dibothriocephalus latus TaxID=60516 RepID=A0A3P6UV95_DIBLA|nr:unnamed protein product [Dibothriocephalus latus]
MNPGNCKKENETSSGYGFGNVSKYAVLTPNDLELRRGYLIFDASFECGKKNCRGRNLGRVEALSEFEYDLYIRPDTCNPKTRNWFYFSVENVRSQQRVIFNITNFTKCGTLYRDGMSPLVMSTSRPYW